MRLLFIDRYFYPDLQATSCLLTDICIYLTQEHEVTVVCGKPSGFSAYCQNYRSFVSREVYQRVNVLRVRSSDFAKENLLMRFLNFITFYFTSFWQAANLGKQDLSVVMTSPPLIGMVAYFLKLFRGTPYLCICQDIFPDSVSIPGRLKNKFLIAVFDWCNRLILKNALKVVALSDLMMKRLTDKGLDQEKIRVIPNWTDSGIVKPMPKDNAFSREHGINNKFAVIYAGNVGFSHYLEDLVYVAKELAEFEDIVFVIIGDGARKKAIISLVGELGLKNVIFLPYQNKEVISSALASGDILVVTLSKGLGGYVVPSRIYGFLSSGRAIICVMDENSEAGEMVKEADCGDVVSPGQPSSLAKSIKSLYQDKQRLAGYAANAAKYAEQKNFKQSSLEKYRVLINSIFQEQNV